MKKELALCDIRTDGNMQHRELDDDQVKVFQALITERPGRLPPIEVMFDGTDYWLYEGHHRLAAYRKLGKKTIPAEVTDGTKREAQLESFHANSEHGLPRPAGTPKKIMMERIFPDSEWGRQTDADIASFVGGVTVGYVSQCRKEFDTPAAEPKKPETKPARKATTPRPQTAEAPEPKPVTDSKGKPVPEHLREVFERIPEIRELVTQLSDVLKTATEAQAEDDLLFVNCKLQQLKTYISNARGVLRFTMPYAVCPMCCGDVNNDDCRTCDGRGFLNDTQYKIVPAEFKGN